MTKVIIVGAAGRMGKKLLRCAQQIEDIEVTGAIEYAEHPDLGKDAGELAEIGNIGVPLTSDLDAALDNSDVIIDFSFREAVPEHTAAAAAKRRAVVIGITGLTEEETMKIMKEADKVPVLWAPNMSLGVNLLFAMVEKAASIQL